MVGMVTLMVVQTAEPAAPRARAPASNAGRILIVRHGPGRGRYNAFLDLVLARAAAFDPATAARIHVHGTGEPFPDLTDVSLVWFHLSDPLEALFPACHSEAIAIAAAARALGARILNPPEELSHTSKSEQLSRWMAAGIPCAAAHRIRTAADLEPALHLIRFPAILRSDLGHTQEAAAVCATPDEARAHARVLPYPAVLIEFVNVREAWRQVEPDTLMARFVHKKRAMVFGDEVLSNHLFFSDNGICGMDVSFFKRADTKLKRFVRRSGLRSPILDEMLEADISFSLGPPDAPDVMHRAMQVLDLDVGAIDYASLPGGDVVLWEANPYFYMVEPQRAVLSRERRMHERNWRFDAAMVRLLEEGSRCRR